MTRRLKLKDRHDEARRVLEALHPGNQDEVYKESEDIELALKMAANHASLKSMFSMGRQRILHRVLLASAIQMMLQVRWCSLPPHVARVANKRLVDRSKRYCILHTVHL